MNSENIVNLMLDGAYLDVREYKFYHPSFKQGFRKMSPGNISFEAAEKKLQKIGLPVEYQNGIIFVNVAPGSLK